MGRRTGQEPAGDQPILVRVLNALDMKPGEFAKATGIPYRDLLAIMDGRPQQLDFIGGDVWWTINEYVDRQVAMLLAAKMDLSRALQKDREQRALRIAALSSRDKRSSPR